MGDDPKLSHNATCHLLNQPCQVNDLVFQTTFLQFVTHTLFLEFEVSQLKLRLFDSDFPRMFPKKCFFLNRPLCLIIRHTRLLIQFLGHAIFPTLPRNDEEHPCLLSINWVTLQIIQHITYTNHKSVLTYHIGHHTSWTGYSWNSTEAKGAGETENAKRL